MDSFYYYESGKVGGPATKEELLALLASGKITLDTAIWQDGMRGWKRVAEAIPDRPRSNTPIEVTEDTGVSSPAAQSSDDSDVSSLSSSQQAGPVSTCTAPSSEALVECFRKAADQGNVDAQWNLAVAYASGLGIPQDYTEAAKWYRLAAQQGHTKAQNNLGVAYRGGKGVPQDYAEAASWFRRAAERGDIKAILNLAHAFASGQGVPEDQSEAVKRYRQAAEQGEVEGQFYLALAYASGEGVAQDHAEAFKWYLKAAEQGDARAQNNLGANYLYANGLPKDYAKAITWLRKAADQGFAIAQMNLGRVYEKGLGVPQSDVEAMIWYRMAADQGVSPAQLALGLNYWKGHVVQQDLVEAFKWMTLAGPSERPTVQELLDFLSGQMSRAEIAEAKRRVSEWKNVRVLRESWEPPRSKAWWELLDRVRSRRFRDAMDYLESSAFLEEADSHERQAAMLWRGAMNAEPAGTAPASSTPAAVLLLALIQAVGVAVEYRLLSRNLLLQLGTAISTVAEVRIADLGDQPYAPEDTPLWLDAITLADAAYQMGAMCRKINEGATELAALQLRARLIVNLLGHCPDRVGEVMVDCAQCALEQGQVEKAASMCESVIDDFTRIRLLERCEQESGALLVEDEIALHKLQDAIDLLNKVRGDKNPEWQMLKARCSALLSR